MSRIRSDLSGRRALRAGVAVAAAMLVAVLLTEASMPIALVIVVFAACVVLSHAIIHRLGLGSDSDDRALSRWGDVAAPDEELLRTSASSGERRGTSGDVAYLPLNAYLEHRYASTVVLTFDQIESLLGFSLPTSARTECEWWTTMAGHTSAWTAAGRTATPHLMARTVSFVRP